MKLTKAIGLSAFAVALAVSALGDAQAAPINILRNPSFENTPCTTPCNQGQGVLPSDWVISQVSPDTYSNDGSYGLAPSGFGNFTGVTAQDGIRWIAGWSSAGHERFGQTLTTPLTAGQVYDFSGYLHQAFRSDLNFPGGYELFLTSSSSGATMVSGAYLGFFGPTTNYADGWTQFALSFTAPGNAAALPFLMFNPVVTGSGNAYPGLDNVSLSLASTSGGGGGTGIPEPASLALLGFGLTGLGLMRKTKRNK